MQAPQVAAVAVRNIPIEHLEMLAAGARRDGLTREQLIRRLIAEWVKENCEPAEA